MGAAVVDQEPLEAVDDDIGQVGDGLVTGGWLAPDAVLVIERSSRGEPFAWPTPLVGLRDRRYGEALLRYGRFP